MRFMIIPQPGSGDEEILELREMTESSDHWSRRQEIVGRARRTRSSKLERSR